MLRGGVRISRRLDTWSVVVFRVAVDVDFCVGGMRGQLDSWSVGCVHVGQPCCSGRHEWSAGCVGGAGGPGLSAAAAAHNDAAALARTCSPVERPCSYLVLLMRSHTCSQASSKCPVTVGCCLKPLADDVLRLFASFRRCTLLACTPSAPSSDSLHRKFLCLLSAFPSHLRLFVAPALSRPGVAKAESRRRYF